MGEVFRARDTELGRDVAIKLLSPRLNGDSNALARFEREARLLASLNHPHIGTLYGVVPHESGKALVLELVAGDTLADIILRGPMPLGNALRFADQIADALETAHERGIVHRDLKPANVKLTEDGNAKVLDFGIAKALEAGDDAATIPAGVTSTGVVIGTRPYMSPEQARGLAIDKRTDVWAFGCVLFEMLTGRRAFDGATNSDVLSAILEKEPEWSAVPASTPEPVRRLLRRTLAKDPLERLRDIGDARIEIGEARRQLASGTSDRALVAPPANRWLTHAVWGAATVAALVIGFVGSLTMRPSPPTDAPVDHLGVPLPTLTTQVTPVIAVSADGRKFAIASADGIVIRDLNQPEARLLRGTAGAEAPFLSPDGSWVAFHVDGRLRKVATDGGEPITIADVPSAQRGFSWGDGDVILIGHTNGPIARVSSSGGDLKAVTTLDTALNETSHRWPHMLPGGRVMLYAAGPSVSANEWNTAHIVAQSLDTGQRRVIAARGSMPAYGAGHVFYVAGRTLLAQRFDPARLDVSGPVVTVLPDVVRMGSGAAWYAVSAGGSLAALRAAIPAPRRLVWIDRSGQVEPLPVPPANYTSPRLSPDGSRVAVTVSNPDSDIWIFDVARGVGTRITSDGKSLWPVWSADGARVLFSSTRGGPAVFRTKLASGSGEDEVLLANSSINRAGSWSPIGEVLFTQVRASASADLWTMKPPAAAQLYFDSQGEDADPHLSPDGKWVAYRSTATGRSEVFIDRLPAATAGRVQLSRGGGVSPVWSRDGREVFFRRDNEIWSVDVSGRESRRFGEPRRLFTTNLPMVDTIFDAALDKRFLVVLGEGPAPNPSEFQLTFNIGTELRRRLAGQ